MRKFKEFTSATLAAAGTYDLEHNNLSYDGFGWKYGFTVTGATTPFDDASFRAAGTPELSQAEQPIIRMRGPSWRHLAAYSSGGYTRTLEGAAGTGSFASPFIDLKKILPGSMVSGKTKSFLRGTAGALADYGV